MYLLSIWSQVFIVMLISSLAGSEHIESAENSPIRLSGREIDCMSDADALQVAMNWQDLLTNYSDALANASLTEDITEESSATNYLLSSSCSNGITPVGASNSPPRLTMDHVINEYRSSTQSRSRALPRFD